MWLPPPILIGVYIGTRFWWIAALGTAVSALACVILYGVARRARDDIRLLDGTVGIPVPDDWRDTAERLPVIANEVSKLVDFIILFADDD